MANVGEMVTEALGMILKPKGSCNGVKLLGSEGVRLRASIVNSRLVRIDIDGLVSPEPQELSRAG